MPKISAGENALAGGFGGVSAVCVSYPFDLLKTRMQFEAGKGAEFSMGGMTRKIWAEGVQRRGVLGGIGGFYRGLDQLLPEAAGKVVLRFVMFKELQNQYKMRVIGDPNATLGFGANIMCGAIAGVVEAGLIVQPFERGKTLRADFASPYKVWGEAFKAHGLRGLFQSVYMGFVPCAFRQIGNQATSFSIFYSLKNAYLERTGEKDLGNLQRLTFGFIGGCSGACVTMPMDVAKTIAQKQQGDKVESMGTIMRNVLKRKGIRGLYAGLTPRLGRVGLDRAVAFMAFEWFLEQLEAYKARTSA